MGKTKKGIWKRRGQGEKRELDQHRDHNKENIEEKIIKRGREIEALIDDKQLEEEWGNRNKCIKLEKSINSPMVKVTSHN